MIVFDMADKIYRNLMDLGHGRMHGGMQLPQQQ